MKLQDLHNNQGLLLLKCISGSRAYGLETPQSDIDLKGVFVLPKQEFYGLDYTEQLSDAKGDEIYYELKRFFQLLVANNPNLVELLNCPGECILHRHPVMDMIRPEMFLSKLCMHTFAGYAQSQIKKARGLKKKIVNPVEKKKKSILDFCYVIRGHGTVTLKQWLEENGFLQEECGLVTIPHMRDVYGLFHNSQLKEGHLKGIASHDEANDVSLSSIPKGIAPLAFMGFNKDGYSRYCRDYREYWEWVEKRNVARYETTLAHGKDYDAKNMMHTFRLLSMAGEIALYKEVRVKRADREFLLRIRKGEFLFEDLLQMAEEKTARIKELFERSDLPDHPDKEACDLLLVKMREELYRE